MTGGWIDNGPVSLPPRVLAYGAGAAVLVLAIAGAGLGFDAAWRRPGGSEPSVAEPANRAGDLIAKPIVEIAPPTPAPAASKDDDDDANDQAKAQALAAQTAAAQALQAKSAAKGDIDDILTSPTEKPPQPVKAPLDEAPPATAPVKTDVPY